MLMPGRIADEKNIEIGRIGSKKGGCEMNAKTMEGLAGAGTNMNLLNTPMRVYKEAERRGDLSMMERAAD